MRIVVIGGTRFIGPHVVGQLAEQGHEVRVYHRGVHTAPLPAGVREVRSDAAGMPVLSFPDELTDPAPDVVIHMIAMGQADAHAAVGAYKGRTGRFVALSSGDVYLAYGRLQGCERGPIEPMPLTEASPLRTVLYPYRAEAKSERDLAYWYDKVLVERAVLEEPTLRGVVLRLPKVYGRGDNRDFATVRAFRDYPTWRWTHGYVENVAAAIVLAALHSAAAGVYNVGEEPTPTVGQRLATLPPQEFTRPAPSALNMAQDMVYDTSRIRRELGYAEPVDFSTGVRRTLGIA